MLMQRLCSCNICVHATFAGEANTPSPEHADIAVLVPTHVLTGTSSLPRPPCGIGGPGLGTQSVVHLGQFLSCQEPSPPFFLFSLFRYFPP